MPTKNEEEGLRDVLRSIKNTDFSGEIIVVDASSTDKTRNIAKKFGCKVFSETGKRSPANAKNIGISKAKGDILVFLNADVIPTHDFFKKIINHKTEWDALYCREITICDSMLERLFYLRSFSSGYTRFPIVIKKYVFKKVKYDANLALGEEDDLIKNIGRHSFKMGKCDALVKSHIPHSFRTLYRQLKWYGRTSFNYFSKYKSPSSFYMLLFLLLPLLFSHNMYLAALSMPIWLYEIYVITKSIVKNKNALSLLFPAFDFIRSIFFLAGMLEFVVHKSVSR